jgi:hypothetical protein
MEIIKQSKENDIELPKVAIEHHGPKVWWLEAPSSCGQVGFRIVAWAEIEAPGAKKYARKAKTAEAS